MAFEYAWAKRQSLLRALCQPPPPLESILFLANKFALIDNAPNAASFAVPAPVAPELLQLHLHKLCTQSHLQIVIQRCNDNYWLGDISVDDDADEEMTV